MPFSRPPGSPRLLRAFLVAVVFVVAQTLLAMSLAPGPRPDEAHGASRYTRLNNWDSDHYSDLVDNGYHMPPPDRPVVGEDVHQFRANLGYFPGYWTSVRTLKRWLGLSTYEALPLTAQLFGVVFWMYLYLMFDAAGVERRRIVRDLALVAAYPSAFFLILGYSESTFMATLAGFLYWSDRWIEPRGRLTAPGARKLAWALAAVHGFAMAGTRIVGIPVAAYPVIRWLAQRIRRGDTIFAIDRRLLAAGALVGVALIAPLLFFLFCSREFGHWDWYFRLQTIGWGKDPNYLAVLDPRSYFPRFFFENTVDSVSRTAVPFTAVLLVAAARRDWRHDKWERLGLYYAAFSLFYISLAAKADTNMDSLIRYTWPAIALLTLARAGQEKERLAEGLPERGLSRGWRATVFLGFAIQLWSTYLFLRGKWVA